ncbi:hypothetical protein [Rathayibacter toxicus]|uniref:DUF7882 domain-containing protein n=1 Tax=Rathayibacter toxicus TaxID=145458 RepID=A0A0C5BQ71_9MICO|nr:hypothetical protein [Rathayibacter toxicus]AJM76787.1 hypothetical protein TI83_00020 [Rathayibacter toxicus]KKM44480.1 hypothetical protein VT73_09965 [Rathayibacter toxicus]QOD08479.1 ATP-dependent DNA ligase [Rathayibacter toxicus]QOD10591.1 ATP-dependent DNA ligase [Rathayibacter toxicus]
MGLLNYNDRTFDFEDRILAHLQVVMAVKLKRCEPFFLSWALGRETGSGRQAIWIAASLPLHFEYFGGRPPSLNRAWIERLLCSASSASGLNLSDERNREPDADSLRPETLQRSMSGTSK